MSGVLAFLRSIIAARGVQLISRYVLLGLVWLLAYAHITLPSDDQTKFTTMVCTIIAGLVCHGIDLWSHALQKTDHTETVINSIVGPRAEPGTYSAPAAKYFKPPLALLMLAALLLCSGCSISDKTRADLKADAQAVVETVLNHTQITVGVTPTGEFTATLSTKADAVPTGTGPQVGDYAVEVETPQDGAFTIPGNKGLWIVQREKHQCYIDAQGRKICK